jgi:hypothetical protein
MMLKAHQQERVPATPLVVAHVMPERCSPARVRFAASRPCLLRAVPANPPTRRAASMRWPGRVNPFRACPFAFLPGFLGIGSEAVKAEGALVSALTASGQCLTQDRGRRRELSISEISIISRVISVSDPDPSKVIRCCRFTETVSRQPTIVHSWSSRSQPPYRPASIRTLVCPVPLGVLDLSGAAISRLELIVWLRQWLRRHVRSHPNSATRDRNKPDLLSGNCVRRAVSQRLVDLTGRPESMQ